jgi:hypothetical protein
LKSRCNNLRWAWGGALVLMGLTGSDLVWGGLSTPSTAAMSQARESYQDSTLQEKQRPPGDQKLPAASGSSGAERATSELRCWQYGRLIFEEKNWRPSRNGPGMPGPVLRSSDPQFDTLRLSSFGNDTFCYMKTREGGD